MFPGLDLHQIYADPAQYLVTADDIESTADGIDNID